MDSDIITVRELAAYLKITEKTAYRLAHQCHPISEQCILY